MKVVKKVFFFQKTSVFWNEQKTSFYSRKFRQKRKFGKISIQSIIDYTMTIIDYTTIIIDLAFENKERFARSEQ